MVACINILTGVICICISILGTGTVVVVVGDENDNSPHLSRKQWHVQVYETTTPLSTSNYTSLLQITAYDEDTNNNFMYRVVEDSGYGWELFGIHVDGYVGHLYTDDILDYENVHHRRGFRFMIEVTDNGNNGWDDPTHTDTAWVNVYVKDINDNPPVFSHPYINITIKENVTIGTVLASLPAVDPDMGGDGSVEYRVECGCGAAVTVDSMGSIHLNNTLDREISTTIEALIVAVDHGNPRLSSTATLTITLEDVNDSPPSLLPPTILHIMENEAPSRLGVLKATDPDMWSDGHGPPFNISLHPHNQPHIFQLIHLKFDPYLDSGRGGAEIWTKCPIDREQHAQLYVLVKLVDIGGIEGINTVTIIINDINDNPMKPAAKMVYLFNIQGGGGSDASLGRVYVDDPDDWDVNDKIYTWLGPAHPLFTLNIHDGTIYAASHLREGRYDLKFLVNDKKWKQSEVMCNVTVLVNILSIDSIINAIPITIINKTPAQLTKGWTPKEGGGVLGSLLHGILDVISDKRYKIEVVSVYKQDIQQLHNHNIIYGNKLSPTKFDRTMQYLPRHNIVSVSSTCVWISVWDEEGSFMNQVKLYGLLSLHTPQIESNTGVKILVGDGRRKSYGSNNSYSATFLPSIVLPLHVVDTNRTSLVTPRLSEAHTYGQHSHHQCDTLSHPHHHKYNYKTCTHNTCLNGGRCVPSSNGNRCVCPGGSVGPQCKKLSRNFKGNGWVWIKPLPTQCLPITISLNIITKHKNALLLYTGPLSPSHVHTHTTHTHTHTHEHLMHTRNSFKYTQHSLTQNYSSTLAQEPSNYTQPSLTHTNKKPSFLLKSHIKDKDTHTQYPSTYTNNKPSLHGNDTHIQYPSTYTNNKPSLQGKDTHTQYPSTYTNNKPSLHGKDTHTQYPSTYTNNKPSLHGNDTHTQYPPTYTNNKPSLQGKDTHTQYPPCSTNTQHLVIPMLAVQLLEGFSEVLYEGYGGPIKLRVNTTLHDYNWHTLHVILDKQGIALIVDRCGQGWDKNTNTTTHCMDKAEWRNGDGVGVGDGDGVWLGEEPIQIGGNAYTSMNAFDHGWQEVPINDKLNGCISHVRINSVLVDLSEAAYSHNSNVGCLLQEEACHVDVDDVNRSNYKCGVMGHCRGGFKNSQCVCDPGWTGSLCNTQTTPVHLGTLSYMKLALSFTPSPHHLTVQLRLRTLGQQNGLLLHLASQHNSGALVVHLKSGVACTSIWRGGKPKLSVCVEGLPLGDGEWHSIMAQHHANNLLISVDDGDEWRHNESMILTTKPSPPMYLDKHDGVTIGGLPQFVGVSLVSVHHDLKYSCLDDVRVCGHILPLWPALNVSEWGQVTTAQHITSGCPALAPIDPCRNVSCPTPLLCHVKWDQPECSCGIGAAVENGRCSDIDECIWMPCLNSGTCINKYPGYLCICHQQYMGDNCQWNKWIPPTQFLPAATLIASLSVSILLLVILGVVLSVCIHRIRTRKRRLNKLHNTPNTISFTVTADGHSKDADPVIVDLLDIQTRHNQHYHTHYQHSQPHHTQPEPIEADDL